jgi:hypothetical protein
MMYASRSESEVGLAHDKLKIDLRKSDFTDLEGT